MVQIQVDLIDVQYDVFIKHSLITDVTKIVKSYGNNKKVLIVTDAYFKDKYAQQLELALRAKGYDVDLYIMTGGKLSKTFNEVLKIYGILETSNYARDSYLIALGGGVIGDLAGFVASTWYRGMNLIHIPTTLMAMVDSSIGGKVAINYRETINAVGNYYHPIVNYMDMDLIDTLPDRDYISGLAEVIKCALIADTELLTFLETEHESIMNRDMEKLVHCIKRSIEIKIAHVKGDVKESNKRLLLNYGHTIGHAIEMATHTEYGETFRHGEGVALGMSAALFLSQSILNLSKESMSKLRNIILLYKLPINFSASEYGYNQDQLIRKCEKIMFKDKKRKDNSLRFILIDKPGHADIYTELDPSLVREAISQIIKA